MKMETKSALNSNLAVAMDTENSLSIMSENDSSERLRVSTERDEKRRYNRMFLPVWIILCIGVCMASAFVTIGIRGAYREQQAQFEKDADEFISNLIGSLRDFEIAALWAHRTCSFTDGVLHVGNDSHTDACTHEDFQATYEYMKSTGLQIRKLAWAPNVTHAKRPLLELESRSYVEERFPGQEYNGFTGVPPRNESSPPTTANFVPREEHPFYFPQHRIAPFVSTRFYDFDLMSSPTRSAAIVQAFETASPCLTERLTPSKSDVMLVHPGISMAPDNANGGPKAVSIVFFNVVELIRLAMERAQPKSKAVYILDDTEGTSSYARYLAGAKLEVVGRHNLSTIELSEDSLKSFNVKSSRNLRQTLLRHEKMVILGSRNLRFLVATVDDTYAANFTFVVMSGALMLLACGFLAAWFLTRMRRARRVSEVIAAAKSEKAALLVESAKHTAAAERELNDYVAHEVRNPLSAALAAFSFVSAAVNKRRPLTTDEECKLVREDMKVMSNSLHFVNDLLRNMLDLHRAANGQLKIDFVPTDVRNDILEPVASMLHNRAEDIRIHVECPENLIVLTDRIRLKQIILNLANNSRKFVQKGFIRIRAEVAKCTEGTEEDQQPVVQVLVEDSGPGIPVEKRNRLFVKFQDSLDNLNQGTGIGLCLCQKLIHLMNGEVFLDESYTSGVEGCPGTRFVVDLQVPPMALATENAERTDTMPSPVALPPEVCPAPEYKTAVEASNSSMENGESPVGVIEDGIEDSELPENLSVLVVDDDLVVRKLFLRACRRVAPAWTMAEASNGETALRIANEKEFDLIMMDQYMASHTKQLLGTETTHALRNQGCRARICGLSANDTEKAFLAAGADCFLLKPFPCEKGALSHAMARVLSTPRSDCLPLQEDIAGNSES